jgi:alpha-1,3-rhamnosyl/mannosyltransferase
VKLIYDMRHLTHTMHGMARYALELLRALLAASGDELGVGVLLRWREHAELVPRDPRVVSLVYDLAPYSPWAQLRLPALLSLLDHDLYHCPFYAPPVRHLGPMVFTVHDLIHLRFPAHHGLKHRVFYRWVVAPAAQRARAVFTVSEHSKADLVELLGVPPEKVVVTPNGVGEVFRPLPAAEREAAARRLGLPWPFVLGVGNPKPHKNLGALVEAWRRLGPGRPGLVLVGVEPGQVAGAEPGPELVMLPGLGDADMAAAYGAAAVVVVPSLYEGFGLPALEALACGAPVVASDRASLPEVVGEAGLLVEPEPEALAWAIRRVLEEEELAARLRAAGPQRARRFSWERTARITLATYRRVLGEE